MSSIWPTAKPPSAAVWRGVVRDWEASPAAGWAVSLGSVALAIAVTRLTWPALARTPFLMLFSAIVLGARFGSEPASWVALVLAIFGSEYVAPPAYRAAAPDNASLLVFVAGAVVMNRVVVARNRAASWLRASEARFRAMWDNAGLGAALLNAQGQVECINPAMERTLGYPSAAWVGVSFSYFSDPDEAGAQRRRFSEFIASGGAAYQTEHRARTTDGRAVWCQITMSPIANPEGGPHRGAVMILEDITVRRQADEALEASERQYRHLFEDNPQAMWLSDPEGGRFLEVNRAATLRYGYSRSEFQALTRRDVEESVLPVEVDEQRAAPGRVSYDARHRARDGRRLDVHVEQHRVRWGSQLADLAFLDDLTERKQLEAHVHQAQKLDALGRLSGGVAHELNNILTPIQGYTDLLLAQIGPDKRICQDLREIASAAVRAKALTAQLLAFSRQEPLRLQTVDVNGVVQGLTRLTRQLIPEDIEIAISPSDARLHVNADVVRFEQVLLNLIINARDAVPRPGGRITIRTWRENPAAAPWRVGIEVADNGHGMDTQTRARAFEPFFTTKPAGSGTGLGLSVVYGIVREFGGHITVESEPDAGTRVTILLPGTDAPVLHEHQPSIASASLVGVEHVLVVEDDQPMRAFVARALRRYGYRVVEASTSEEALALEGDSPIDVLVADVVLPRMNGPRLAAALKERRPQLLVVYMSGHAVADLARDGIPLAPADLLLKPFSAADLVGRIRRLIDDRAVGDLK